MIKVLHVFGKMDRGGAEMRTIEVMPLLVKKGVRLDFCTISSNTDIGQLDERIRLLGGEVYPFPLKPHIVGFGSRFVRFLKQHDYDIVHSHIHYASGFIVWLTHKAGVKGRIAHFRSMGDGKKITLRRKLYHSIMRRMIDKHATGILAVGYGAMEYSWGQDWHRDPRCKVVHNGLDLTAFRQAPLDRNGVRSELHISEDSRLVIYVGRFTGQKGHDVLLDAAVRLIAANPKIHLLFAGDGKTRQAMEAKAKDLKIEGHVHFLGTRNDVPRLLKASDCFVLPSFREGLPGVVLEAIAANLPVVATDLPGVREIAEHTNLIGIVPVGNRDALADTISKNIDAATDRPPATSTFPQEFDLHNCAEQLFEVYCNQLK